MKHPKLAISIGRKTVKFKLNAKIVGNDVSGATKV